MPVGAKLAQLFVGLLAFLLGLLSQHVVAQHAAAREARGFLEDVVGVLPVEAGKAHLLRELPDCPPVGLGLARCVVELGV